MKRYRMSFAASLDHAPEAPERTARRHLNSFDVEFQVWPNRAALARSVRMQQRRAPRQDDWRPVQALETTEGY